MINSMIFNLIDLYFNLLIINKTIIIKFNGKDIVVRGNQAIHVPTQICGQENMRNTFGQTINLVLVILVN